MHHYQSCSVLFSSQLFASSAQNVWNHQCLQKANQEKKNILKNVRVWKYDQLYLSNTTHAHAHEIMLLEADHCHCLLWRPIRKRAMSWCHNATKMVENKELLFTQEVSPQFWNPQIRWDGTTLTLLLQRVTHKMWLRSFLSVPCQTTQYCDYH